jgi:hypothetical protein
MAELGEVLARLGGRYAAELGIDLKSGPPARQQWFLAAILFGARISGQLAARTYRVFAARGVFSPQAVLDQGWDRLVELLDEGGYARYDYKTATKLLKVMESLKEGYQGDLERLHAAARDPVDLEARLQALAPGIGEATVNIFLRELRGIWPKAAPHLSPLARQAALALGWLAPGLSDQEALKTLEDTWQARPAPGYDFADLEAALVRRGLELRRARKKTGVRG